MNTTPRVTIFAEMAKEISRPIEPGEDPSPMIKQGAGYSLDGGYFWRRGNTLYWASGEVTEVKRACLMRYLPSENSEDFSAWTDEHRAAVLAETMRKREEFKRKEQERADWVSERVRSAEAKLTEEEIEALQEFYSEP